jgi:short-subunit dehydrogenase
MNVSNKTIIVTGGGDGMGRELVLLLLKKNARVAAIDIRQQALDETIRLAGGNKSRLSSHVLNITDKAAVEKLPEEIIAIHGSIDGLINNAGIIQPFVKIKDLQYDAIDRVMQVNFFGMLYMTKTFLPHLLKRPEAHIVNTSSMGGFLPVPGQSIYGASKAAVKLFTEGLHSELTDTNVRVTIVFPGAIGTHIAENSGIAFSKEMQEKSKSSSIKMLSASKAAELMIEGMEKNAYRVLVGSDSKFMDFLYRLNPKYAAGFIYKQMKSLLPA